MVVKDSAEDLHDDLGIFTAINGAGHVSQSPHGI